MPNYFSQQGPHNRKISTLGCKDHIPHGECVTHPTSELSFIRCLEYDTSNSLIRWHCHKAYELHLITGASGRVLIGDYIGRFEPGSLVLIGPCLPHHWASDNTSALRVQRSGCVVQFPDDPLRQASALIPELLEVLPLLTLAKQGIEFLGMSELTKSSMLQMFHSSGQERFSIFLTLLSTLLKHQDYRLLSSAPLSNFKDDDKLNPINTIMDYISENYASCTLSDIADRVGMTSNRFSRYFQRATGSPFTHFLYTYRISCACQRLMRTNEYIHVIGYQVGFSNTASFNRVFLRVKGMTPSEFRRQIANMGTSQQRYVTHHRI